MRRFYSSPLLPSCALRAASAGVALFAAFGFTGCATMGTLVGIPLEPGSGSSLSGKSQEQLTEIGVDALLGTGNRIEGERVGSALTEEDHVLLAFKVFVPALKDPATQEAIKEAREEFDSALSRRGAQQNTERLSEEELAFFAVVHPGARLAFIARLLEGHPRHAELLDKATWHAATHDAVRFILFPDPQHRRGDSKAKPSIDTYTGVDGPGHHSGVSDLWSVYLKAGDPYAVEVAAPVFRPAAAVPEARTIDQLTWTALVLARVSSTSSHRADAGDLLAQTSHQLLWKQSETTWNPAAKTFGTAEGFRRQVQQAISLLEQIPATSPLHREAKARIAQGTKLIKRSKQEAEAADREYERQQKAYLASLSADQRRVYKELGRPYEDDPGPNGGRIWRYRESLYTNAFGERILIAYRWKVYTFAARGR